MFNILDFLEEIWELPWYKAVVIAIMDDCVVILRSWWLFLGLLIFILLWNHIKQG